MYKVTYTMRDIKSHYWRVYSYETPNVEQLYEESVRPIVYVVYGVSRPASEWFDVSVTPTTD